MCAFQIRYETYREAVERYLETLFTGKRPYGCLYEAMRYSLLSGGKRLRPVLTLAFCDALGGPWRQALPFACAVELVHTYSLIHDDLPCMDNDDLRRGKPTCHKAFGETLAVLAGDALQPEAFRLIASAEDMTDTQRSQAALVLSTACGADGMVGGQVLDTQGSAQDRDSLAALSALKTGAMTGAACELGCVAADKAEARPAAAAFGRHLGLAFQVRDDLLDVIGTQDEFGKPIGSDAEEGKLTFMDLLGQSACEALVREETRLAKEALSSLPDNGFLLDLADWLAGRRR